MSAESRVQPLPVAGTPEKTVIIWGTTHDALKAMQARERDRRGARTGPPFAELIARAIQKLEQEGI